MKKYKKKPSKLLQIRLGKKEHKEVLDFIKTFNVTQREFILAVINTLRDNEIIRENYFWENNKSFAYFNEDRYNKQINKDSKCEECGAGHPPDDEKRKKQLERHHYAGYAGENAFKVQILCRPCHWKKPKNYKIKRQEN